MTGVNYAFRSSMWVRYQQRGGPSENAYQVGCPACLLPRLSWLMGGAQWRASHCLSACLSGGERRFWPAVATALAEKLGGAGSPASQSCPLSNEYAVRAGMGFKTMSAG